MIGSVQQKPSHRFGHDHLARTLGVNTMPIREAVRQAQPEAQSTSHRCRGARAAKLFVGDCQDSYRTIEAPETREHRWAGVDTIFLF